jgi:hypothetical protein
MHSKPSNSSYYNPGRMVRSPLVYCFRGLSGVSNFGASGGALRSKPS